MSGPLDADQRAHWKQLAEAATPGPWWREGDDEHFYGMRRGGRPNGEGIGSTRYYGKIHPDATADAEFIAAARTAVPELLEALEAAEAENQRLKVDMDRILALAEWPGVGGRREDRRNIANIARPWAGALAPLLDSVVTERETTP